MRWIAWAKASARTGLPSLKRKPRRSLKVYVRPSAEIVGAAAATSGTSWYPCGGFRSRYRISRAHTVSRSTQLSRVEASAGST